ncbi:hypothetical protein [Salinisphaera hydrothermalis]|uniref:hypothetical protein n=1 Tax=Salinisphaera hydrothermalis TaxID=563188 RepID=UPI001E522FBA|nr:hypothetical protein [Salinisphaera hydrothermalis]
MAWHGAGSRKRGRTMSGGHARRRVRGLACRVEQRGVFTQRTAVAGFDLQQEIHERFVHRPAGGDMNHGPTTAVGHGGVDMNTIDGAAAANTEALKHRRRRDADIQRCPLGGIEIAQHHRRVEGLVEMRVDVECAEFKSERRRGVSGHGDACGDQTASNSSIDENGHAVCNPLFSPADVDSRPIPPTPPLPVFKDRRKRPCPASTPRVYPVDSA